MKPPRIWVDLDETLVANEIDFYTGQVRKIYPRPGVDRFLGQLSYFGRIWILTKASIEHARRAIGKLGPAGKLIRGVVSREDLEPVAEKVEAILTAPISDESKNVLLKSIHPLFPPGVIFDNMEVDSFDFYVKTVAVGVGQWEWIKVEPFTIDVPDLGGLERAFSEFLVRFQPASNPSLKGVVYA